MSRVNLGRHWYWPVLTFIVAAAALLATERQVTFDVSGKLFATNLGAFAGGLFGFLPNLMKWCLFKCEKCLL
ncbi:hypothetical protein C6H68_23950 [Photorhabdus luminescens]|uniref:Uncharacterized protein n=1 Tax=Photorhabdus laumondii subsp. clarkei TaxID=2029685 RepID=A0A329VAN7_9GAMM|nr:hypothetical protein [Photorhabdus laumondii]PQQ35643.1 hypothetical protein C6H68_23950 [Photorhabdus luminescens]RAW85474.1 hypothetical protein CKY01_19310 [Photorhabdus laumondii subsp. clarkei]